jgi:O6-methylguanine-DNA--protein-cysteine methyltransferase
MAFSPSHHIARTGDPSPKRRARLAGAGQDRFPEARLIGADGDYEALVARVVAFVEAPHLGLDLPLDVRGTAFQQRVWQALQEIPVGQTVSYAEVPRRIGSPKAVRAVAGAVPRTISRWRSPATVS